MRFQRWNCNKSRLHSLPSAVAFKTCWSGPLWCYSRKIQLFSSAPPPSWIFKSVNAKRYWQKPDGSPLQPYNLYSEATLKIPPDLLRFYLNWFSSPWQINHLKCRVRACLNMCAVPTAEGKAKGLWQKLISLSESVWCASVSRGHEKLINYYWFGLQSLRRGFTLGAFHRETTRQPLGLFDTAGCHLSRGRETERHSIKNRAVNQQADLEAAESGTLPSCWRVCHCRK